MCEFSNAIFLLNFENFEKILFDLSVVPKMEWEKPPRSLILENDVFVDTLLYTYPDSRTFSFSQSIEDQATAVVFQSFNCCFK